MINVNLVSDALIHCLKVSGARILLVDENEKCRARIGAESQRIEAELEMKIVDLSGQLKKEIAGKKAERIDEVYRKDIKGNSPVALFYTRYVPSFKILRSGILHYIFWPCLARGASFRSLLLGPLLIFTTVARQDFKRASLSLYPDSILQLLLISR